MWQARTVVTKCKNGSIKVEIKNVYISNDGTVMAYSPNPIKIKPTSNVKELYATVKELFQATNLPILNCHQN